MESKKGFFRKKLLQILLVLGTIIVGIMGSSPVVWLVGIGLGLMIVAEYRKYDQEVQDADDWWNTLDKEGKLGHKKG